MKKIKILPVFPKFPSTFWSYQKALEYVRKKAVMPPTGLATVLAMLPEDNFYSHRIIDLNIEPLKEEYLKNTDIVFTSSMVVQEDSHNEIIEMAHFYGKKVVAGGPFPTSYFERNKNADYIISGEAEITLMPFLEDLLKGNPKKLYTEKEVIKAGRCYAKLTKTGKPDITKTPVPRWDLLDLGKYHTQGIQYSRGCPHNCEFCDITALFGRNPRTKTPEQMILELNSLYDTGYRGSVFIVDDNFIGNRKNVKEFLPEIISWQQEKDYPFSFFTEATTSLAWDENKGILEKMVKAGFNQVFIGIESIDPEVLEKTKKKQNIKMPALKSVKRIQEAGLEVTGGFIVGLDDEKPEVCDQLYDFIQTSGIVVAMPGLLTVLNNTDLYCRLKKEGRLKGESKGNNTHNLSFNFKTLLDEGFLIKEYKNLLRKLNIPKNYYDRCRVLQKNLGPSRLTNRKNLEGILAFGKSLKNLTFAKGGWEYIKYLTETLVKNPEYFSEAVTQAIKWHHFNTITKVTLDEDDSSNINPTRTTFN